MVKNVVLVMIKNSDSKDIGKVFELFFEMRDEKILYFLINIDNVILTYIVFMCILI